MPTGQPGRTGSGVLVALALCTLLLLGVTFFLSGIFGTGTVLWLGVLAMVPLGLCLVGLRWVDRWDPEPRPVLLLALLWGAGASVAGALLVGDLFTELFFDPAGRLDLDTFGAVVQAPIVEELAKGAGVLLIFWLNRAHFDGPVDGIVYGGMVGAGFAFTENILYFGSSYAESGTPGDLAAVFVLRGLFSPFAHVMFTAWTGFALGLCAERGDRSRWPLYLGLGLLPAMFGHFLWNGGVGIFFDSFLGFYFLLQVPLFVAAVVSVVLLQRAELRLIARRLDEYRQAGWFTPAEVAMFATPAGRKSARAWAAAHGRGARDEGLHADRDAPGRRAPAHLRGPRGCGRLRPRGRPAARVLQATRAIAGGRRSLGSKTARGRPAAATTPRKEHR